jgi:asparagine synthase (glutamine-hydrolysing)
VETGHQPVYNEDQTIYTVFNGEIYNYLELRQEMLDKGHKFYTDHSDTELIVHLYEDFGTDLLRRIVLGAVDVDVRKLARLCQDHWGNRFTLKDPDTTTGG